MATVTRINSACTEVLSDDEQHIAYVYSHRSEDDGAWIFVAETPEEMPIETCESIDAAIEAASTWVEDQARNCDVDEGGEADDAYALASAGFGMDEDYGCTEEV